MASERFDEFMRQAQAVMSPITANAYATLAAADALGRIADVLEAAWEDTAKDLLGKEGGEHGKGQ